MKKNYKKPLMNEVTLKVNYQLLAGSTNASGNSVSLDDWDLDTDDQS